MICIKMVTYYIVLFLLTFVTINSSNDKCQKIKVKTCISEIYNNTNGFSKQYLSILGNTRMPNKFKQNQTEVENAFRIFNSVHKSFSKCSQHLKLFLCVAHLPICFHKWYPIYPCPSMCNEVKSNCKYYINSLPSKLRRAFECDIYEIYKDNTCFSVNITKLSKPKQTKRYKFECPLELRVHPSKKYSLKVGDETVANCGVPCQDDALIGRSERQFARYWILAWAILCFASTLFTIATYFIDRTRFRYPERPIILISGCYCMISIAYICGAFLGSSASCAGTY